MTRSSATIPAEQGKIIKFNMLLANCVIFDTALNVTAVLRELAAARAGTSRRWRWARCRRTSPSRSIKRFGEYATDGLTILPAAFDARLDLPTSSPARRPRRTWPQ